MLRMPREPAAMIACCVCDQKLHRVAVSRFTPRQNIQVLDFGYRPTTLVPVWRFGRPEVIRGYSDDFTFDLLHESVWHDTNRANRATLFRWPEPENLSSSYRDVTRISSTEQVCLKIPAQFLKRL